MSCTKSVLRPSVFASSSHHYRSSFLDALLVLSSSFWWIAGDCLGFRRGEALNAASKPYKFAASLRHGPEMILPYDEQVRKLVSRGFAVWDVVRSCTREGSLDQNIRGETPNDIPAFCRRHKSIRRIVLANGGTGSAMFVKHFRSWIRDPDGDDVEFVVADNDASRQAFGKVVVGSASGGGEETLRSRRSITLVSAISVSPAAARYSYEEKRDFWEKYVYRPGLEDWKATVAEFRG